MKKYYTLLLIAILCSCDSFFHEVDNSYLKIDTQQEKDEMINGIYARLVDVHDGEYFMIQSRSDDNRNYTSGYSYSSPDGRSRCSGGPSDRTIFAGANAIGNIYVNLYAAIININKLLHDLSDQNDKRLLGEIHFLRAYCYFKLVRVFGTPPLVEDIVVNYELEKPTYRDVYGFIEADLLKALKLLPDSYTEARIPGETPHQGTAKALLAEVYLTMAGFPVKDESKYAEAARLSEEVIEQAERYNYSLQPDFAKLWDEDNKHDQENIFGLFFTSGTQNNRNEIGQNSLRIIPSTIPAMKYILSSRYHPQPKFFDNFPNNYRKYTSYTTGYYQPINYVLRDTTIQALQFFKLDPLNPCKFKDQCISLKWVGHYQKYFNGQSNLKTGTTLHLLRYAQTLLTYAEAKARSGKLDQSAYDAVNKIRRRANQLDINTPSKYDLTPNLSAEQFIDSVVWERAWELCCEPDGRWFDVIRLELKDKISVNESPFIINGIYLTEDWYFYKIPEEDRWINRNFLMVGSEDPCIEINK